MADTTSFSVKLEADVKDIQNSLNSVRGELNRLKGDFDSWSRSVVGSVERVTQSIQGLGSAVGGVGTPSMGGAGGAGPSLGYGGGGGVLPGPGSGGGGMGGIGGGLGSALGSATTGSMLSAATGGLAGVFMGAIRRFAGFSFGMAMEALGQGAGMVQQYQASRLYATGMPGGVHPSTFKTGASPRIGGLRGFGLNYGMTPAETVPYVHGIRQMLAPSIDPMTARLAGTPFLAEELASVYGFGTGVHPQMVAAQMAQSQIGGRTARGGFTPSSGLTAAPGAQILSMATYLATSEAVDGVSQFGATLQDVVPLMGSLNSILSQHLTTATMMNPRMMNWATAGMGSLMQMGRDPAIAQNIVGRLFQGMANPGGGDMGRALAMQAVGYMPGMDPQEALLRLESGEPQYLTAIIDRMQQYAGPGGGRRRIEHMMSSVFGLSATQARDAYDMQAEMRTASPERQAELTEGWQALLRGEVAPDVQGVHDTAVGSIGYLRTIVRFQTSMQTLAEQNIDLLTTIKDWQIQAVEALKNVLSILPNSSGGGSGGGPPGGSGPVGGTFRNLPGSPGMAAWGRRQENLDEGVSALQALERMVVDPHSAFDVMRAYTVMSSEVVAGMGHSATDILAMSPSERDQLRRRAHRLLQSTSEQYQAEAVAAGLPEQTITPDASLMSGPVDLTIPTTAPTGGGGPKGSHKVVQRLDTLIKVMQSSNATGMAAPHKNKN